MTDFSTRYLGLSLVTPLVPSASPLTKNVDVVKAMEANGAGAVVLPSLFEEQIEQESQLLDHFMSQGSESQFEALYYLPELQAYNNGPEQYAQQLDKIRQAVSIPVIASLNGYSTGGWTRYACRLESAGASALELNLYYVAADPELTSIVVEERYCRLLQSVRAAVKIPIAVKLGTQFTALTGFARRLVDAGADALVLFNRFYQPDFDLESVTVVPRVHLSTPAELLERLRWMALLKGRVNCQLAVTGGVHGAEDVLKALMAGADVVQMASALIQRGPGHLRTVLDGMEAWMREHEYVSTDQMRGSLSQQHVTEPALIERAQYLQVLSTRLFAHPVL